MNVLLISHCSKQALIETRRILDQFAERKGDRTWQTPITQAGLDTLRRLLCETACKNTAVACHWLRGIDRSELLWIVGDADRFNSQGATPTNTTGRDVLRQDSENHWHSLRVIRLLSCLAALLHDLGKACGKFQDRLTKKNKEKNLYRHEWISLRLFQAFVGNDGDEGWLSRLADPSQAAAAGWLDRLQKDGIDAAVSPKPFASMPPLAQAVAWLFLSHHRLPSPYDDPPVDVLDHLPDAITAQWNEPHIGNDKHEIVSYWEFKAGLPVEVKAWRDKAAAIAGELLELAALDSCRAYLDDPYIMHLSRLTLMLADHTYSSMTDPRSRLKGSPECNTFANTDRKNGKPNQKLDEHLLGVEKFSRKITRLLPHFADALPCLGKQKKLSARSRAEKFRWQDKAAELAAGMRDDSVGSGAFIINMASTGCGKTFANARIMNALADPEKGMRCAFALGLRTLTLQTGNEYRRRIGLGDDVMAVRVGGGASRILYERGQEEAGGHGAESSDLLLPEEAQVQYAGDEYPDPALYALFKDERVRNLLTAPVLVCTIDHLMPATESARGGHQIIPMLRLLSGDLVLDELDDYDINDIPAVTRLVNWAGMLGCRIMLSSATLPPALVKGMFMAYLKGREHFQRHRGERPGEAPRICCAWIDEFNRRREDCAEADAFSAAHRSFVEKRVERLAKEPIRRRGELIEIAAGSGDKKFREDFARQALAGAERLHKDYHSIDPKSGKRVSFGLVRMANIEPLFDVALALYRQRVSEGYRIHLCAYHSQYPLLLRSAIEKSLDRALDRREPEAVFTLPEIRRSIDAHGEQDQIFIVLGTPVAEVGRDHDYDWAVVEPSSMRSIIQLAGRVRRHRDASAAESPNMLIFERNLKSLECPDKPAYCRPGFETAEFKLSDHSLRALLAGGDLRAIDSRPRIVERLNPDWKKNLADLEHERLGKIMLAWKRRDLSERAMRNGESDAPPSGAYSWWVHSRASLTGVLQKKQPFRLETEKHWELALLPDEDGREYRLVHLFDPESGSPQEVRVEHLNRRMDDGDCQGERIQSWGVFDYMTELSRLAEELALDRETCARRFGTVTLPESGNGWRFHPALGFARQR